MKPETTSRVMDIETGETMEVYPQEYCDEWNRCRETGEKTDRLDELQKRYRVRRYKVTYELMEEDND